MAYSSYAVLPGMRGAPCMAVSAISDGLATIGTWYPFTVTPVNPIFVANGNGVTLVTGAQAAGARPGHGQQWPRGSHVVLSQYATQYAGVGQRV